MEYIKKEELKDGDIFEDLIIEKMVMSVDNNILTTYKPKIKEPIFQTEDGVDIFEGDNIYWVNINTFEKINCNKYNDDLGEISIKSLLSKKYECKAIAFSTKKKAKEYILLNKPCLSLKDVASIYISADRPIIETTSFSAQNRRIQELIKQKIKQ